MDLSDIQMVSLNNSNNQHSIILTDTTFHPRSLQVAPIFLVVQAFPYNSIWFVEIYARTSIPKLFFVSHDEGGKKYCSGLIPFTLTGTLQSEFATLSREVQESVRSLPTGTCCPLAGQVIFTKCKFG